MVRTRINPQNLDFDELKQSFKDFLQTKETYKDYDFDGSNLSILLDLFAYNTHAMFLNAYINFNETNLESAQIRGNVVSKANQYGYKTRSRIASTATVNIVVRNPIGTSNTLTLNRGTRLTTTLNNTEYPFIVNESVTVNKAIDGNFYFNNVTIKQGILRRNFFVYDNRENFPKFTIPDINIDTTTLEVQVKEHDSATEYEIYNSYTGFSNLNGDSLVYYIDENYDGVFDISFGDNVLGKKLTNNNVIRCEYLSTKGLAANGALIFSMTDDIGGNNEISVTTISNSKGGLDKEDIETIRFNSVRLFQSQNRAVTETDYIPIIANDFKDIETITSYGGENLTPPQFGKNFISIKPFNRDTLDDTEKDLIINGILVDKRVGSIIPVIVDPDYTYIRVECNYKFNPNLTSLSSLDLTNGVKKVIQNYNTNTLQKFGGVFRLSNILSQIDNSNVAIISSVVNILPYKIIIPSNNSPNFFELKFVNEIYSVNTNEFTVTSDPIIIGGISYLLADRPTDNPDIRRLFIYRIVNNEIQSVINNAGTLTKSTRTITVQNFIPDTTTPIRIFVRPNTYDINPKFNQLLSIEEDQTIVIGDVDTISIGGSGLGSMNFTSTPIKTL